MKSFLLASALLALSTAPASGIPELKVKPGLWRFSTMVDGKTVNAIQVCVGDKEQKAFEAPDAEYCPGMKVEPIGMGYSIDMQCKAGDVENSIKGTVTGDFENHYLADIEVSLTGAGINSKVRSQVAAMRVGDCPPGMKPDQTAPGKPQ